MLHRIALLGALALAYTALPATAQTVQVLPTCGSASDAVGPGGRLYTDTTGTLCTVAGGGGSSSTGSVTASGTNGTQAQAVQGINGGVPQNVQGTGTAGTPATGVISVQGVANGTPQNVALPAGATTTTGALQPPTAAAGKATPWFASLSATTSTQLLAANANRLAYSLQCSGTAPVAVSETGATLTTATPASGSNITLIVPSGATPYFTPAVASLTAITGYTGTAQTCWGVEYLR